MTLPDCLPADPEHAGDHRPADPTTGEPVDLLIDEQLRAARVSGQLDQPQRPRISNDNDNAGGRGLLAVLTHPATLTATHANNDRDTRPHHRPHQRPGTVMGTVVGTPGW